jgi:hypothetical protein
MQRTLSAWIDAEEERDRLTREALADADTGLVIDHQAGQAGPMASALTIRCRCRGHGIARDRHTALRFGTTA